MEALADLWSSFAGWWAALPPLPDLGLPAPGNGDLMIVIGTLVGGLGLAGLTNGWVERRVSKSGIFATLVGVLLLFWVWENRREAGFAMIPEAFIEVLADIIR